MTDRRPTGNAGRILATGASIAAGLGLIGAMDTAAGAASAASTTVAPSPVQVIRRVVVVPTPQPDVVLQASSAGPSVRIIEQAPPPIIRTRPAATSPTQSAPPAQSTSSGS